MDISDAMKGAENAVRDIVTYLLAKKYGVDWPVHSGVSKARIEGWYSKQAEEKKRIGRADPRIIYYADFFDLQTLVAKSWDHGLCEVFKKQKELLALHPSSTPNCVSH